MAKLKPLLELGQVIKQDGRELEVVTVSTNDNPDYPINFTYELAEKSEMDAKRAADEQAASQATLEAQPKE